MLEWRSGYRWKRPCVLSKCQTIFDFLTFLLDFMFRRWLTPRGEMMDIRGSGGARFVVELFGSDANGRKMIAWGRSGPRMRGQC